MAETQECFFNFKILQSQNKIIHILSSSYYCELSNVYLFSLFQAEILSQSIWVMWEDSIENE